MKGTSSKLDVDHKHGNIDGCKKNSIYGSLIYEHKKNAKNNKKKGQSTPWIAHAYEEKLIILKTRKELL